MSKLFSKLNLTKLFSKLEIITIIHQPEWPKKLFTAQCSGIDWREGISQTIIITSQTRIVLKNKLSYSPIAQETIIIIDLTRKDLKNKLSYLPNSPENYHNHRPNQWI